jgi:chromosome segregation ATPase
MFQQEAMELRLKLIAKETHHAELLKRCEGLEQVNEETWKKCVALGRSEEMIRIENEILKKQNTSLQQEVQETLRSGEEVKRMRERLQGEVKYYLNEMEERAQEEKKREERRELARAEELLELRKEKKSFERFVTEIEKKLQRAESVVEEAVCEKEVQQKKCVELQCVVQDLSSQLRSREKEWERCEGELRGVLEMRERQLVEMRREKERLQSDLKNEMKRSLNLGKEFDEEVMKRERLSVENENLEREMQKMREENEELRGEVVKHRKVISFINQLSVGTVTTEELMRVGGVGDGGGKA